ncbi:immune-associated nucleotide-binding protein 9-like [Cyprinodon tularosa]|uniref:immune-associated nucleotide-binding protein 9-like n=1 Tax=Cyprinodon tularosa TaxID=77115 RepID=UPI0018E25910|nr:immune-associated nucleotide-binding protein 9-like [Cyprinodon tularosa]
MTSCRSVVSAFKKDTELAGGQIQADEGSQANPQGNVRRQIQVQSTRRIQQESGDRSGKQIRQEQAGSRESKRHQNCSDWEDWQREELIRKHYPGKKPFEARSSQRSVTKKCVKTKTEVDGRSVYVVDTPGLFDTSLSLEEIQEELVGCINYVAPGPHVFLLVIRIGRFTSEEIQTLENIKKIFGKNSEKFTIVLLTGGDSLEEEGSTVKDYIKNESEDSFKKLIKDCGGRYHLFNNKDPANRTQVRELIKKIDTMVKENGGSCFTNEMLQEAQAAIQKNMKNILKEREEEIKTKVEELEIDHEAEIEVLKRRLEKERAENELKKKYMLEMEEKIKRENEQRMREQEYREEEERRREMEKEMENLVLMDELVALEEKMQSGLQDRVTEQFLEKEKRELEEKKWMMEKERQEWWEKKREEEKQRRLREQLRMNELKEEYEKAKRNAEEILKEQHEKELRHLKEEYQKKQEEMKTTFIDEVRKEAEKKGLSKSFWDFQSIFKQVEKKICSVQ